MDFYLTRNIYDTISYINIYSAKKYVIKITVNVLTYFKSNKLRKIYIQII